MSFAVSNRMTGCHKRCQLCQDETPSFTPSMEPIEYGVLMLDPTLFTGAARAWRLLRRIWEIFNAPLGEPADELESITACHNA